MLAHVQNSGRDMPPPVPSPWSAASSVTFIICLAKEWRALKQFSAAGQSREWSRRSSVRRMLHDRIVDRFSTRTANSIDGLIIDCFLQCIWVDSHHENTHEFVAAQFPFELRKVTGKSIYRLVQQQCRVTYPWCSFRDLPHVHYYRIIDCMGPKFVDVLNCLAKRLIKST